MPLLRILGLLLPRVLLPGLLLFAISGYSFGQTRGTAAIPKPAGDDLAQMRSSAAFAELKLKRTELVSELESLILDYTEEFPKVAEMRFTVTLIDRDIARLAKVKSSEASKLTLALGKLMVRRVELETDVWGLQRSYKDEHPDVKRAKRKLEIYEAAVNEILN
ncbi:MAG: hypothetical protein ABIO91_01075 [Pyrinomonadaceae bacterium]